MGWRVSSGKAFLRIREDCFTVPSTSPWKELLERLNSNCALVNVFKIFFFPQLWDLGVLNSLLNRLSKRQTQLALLRVFRR